MLQRRPYTFAQTNLPLSFFACDKAADHTFLFANKPSGIVGSAGTPLPSPPARNSAPMKSSLSHLYAVSVTPEKKPHPRGVGRGRVAVPGTQNLQMTCAAIAARVVPRWRCLRVSRKQ